MAAGNYTERKVDFELFKWQQLRDYLNKENQLPEDDEGVLDLIEGSTDLTDMLIELAKEYRLAKAYAEGVAGYIEDLTIRKERHEHRAERYKNIIQRAMDSAGMRKLPDNPVVTAYTTQGLPELHIDEDMVKRDGVYVRVEAKVDRKAIRDAINAGKRIDGVSLGNGAKSLTLKFR